MPWGAVRVRAAGPCKLKRASNERPLDRLEKHQCSNLRKKLPSQCTFSRYSMMVLFSTVFRFQLKFTGSGQIDTQDAVPNTLSHHNTALSGLAVHVHALTDQWATTPSVAAHGPWHAGRIAAAQACRRLPSPCGLMRSGGGRSGRFAAWRVSPCAWCRPTAGSPPPAQHAGGGTG